MSRLVCVLIGWAIYFTGLGLDSPILVGMAGGFFFSTILFTVLPSD